MQIIVFTLNKKYYAVSSKNVIEITEQLPTSLVPKSPEWVEGLINIRGNAVTLVNLYKLIQNTSSNDDLRYDNIIIMDMDGSKIAFEVETVKQVIDIDPSTITKTASNAENLVTGIIPLNGQVVSIIDMSILFTTNEG